jgi:hypothetical protein
MPDWMIQWTDHAWEQAEERGLDHDQVTRIVCYPASRGVSRRNGLPIAFGRNHEGRELVVVYRKIDRRTARIVTVFETGR